MNATVAVLAILLFVSSAVADKPKTVNEAVQILKTKWLQPKDREWILRNPKDEVRNHLYMGFGTGLRNQFGLWGNNQPIRDSCGTNDPEGCSVGAGRSRFRTAPQMAMSLAPTVGQPAIQILWC